MTSKMRPLAIATVLAGTVGLVGCETKPVDPYSGMRMLSPEEAGAREQPEDPVQQAERNFNAKFARKNPQAR